MSELSLSFAKAEAKGASVASAVDDAFRAHAAGLYRYIYGKMGHAATAEDLTAQVFLKALRWLQEGRSAESVRGWLYATARTELGDYWREQGRARTLPLADVADMPAGAPTVEPDAEGAPGARERASRLLELLPERERRVLILRYLRGYTAAEVGHALGLSANHVRVLQLRALRRRLRKG